MHKISQTDIDTFYRTIGTNVMRIRKEKGMTQLDLALAIGLKSVGLISVAELYHNKKHFNLEHLYKIAVVLDVAVTDFFNDTADLSLKHKLSL
jgi:transcriptional regulator with XRE-family HTH domain